MFCSVLQSEFLFNGKNGVKYIIGGQYRIWKVCCSWKPLLQIKKGFIKFCSLGMCYGAF